MHNPTKITYEGDAATAENYVGEARTLLSKARSVAEAAGVGMFVKSAKLADGVIVTALYTTQQSVIHITTSPTKLIKEQPNLKIRRRPSFYSGVVKGGTLETVSLRPQTSPGWDFGAPPSGETRIDMMSYKPTLKWRSQYNTKVAEENKANEDVPGYVPRQTLGADYQPSAHLAVDAQQWNDVFPQPNEKVVPSQYYKITPSCYSGQMKKLVQYVLGLGRLDEEELVPNDPYLDDVKQHGFQVRYDFRWQTTHGLVKGADKRWWLVEIGMDNGVLAMPLPLYEDYAEDEVITLDNPQEEMAVIKREFGGQPTGGTFPAGTALTEALKRGEVLQLLKAEDVAEFYKYSPYSTCHGWAFSSDGHEAHNTAHTIEEYSDGFPVGVGVHYRVVFSIGAINKTREEGEPIATASAAISRVSRGYLCRPGPKYGAQYHVPEPLLEGGAVITYNFLQRKRNYPRCDTTVGVFFVGKTLKLIRFYLNPTAIPAHIDGTPPYGCGEYSGSFAWTEYSAGGYIPPQFYTSDYDYREKIAASVTEHSHTAVLGGYTGPLVNDHLDDVKIATVRRERSTTIRTFTTAYISGNYGTHIACPYGAREAYVIYYGKTWDSSYTARGYRVEAIPDPNQALTFRYFYPRRPKPNTCFDDDIRKVYSLFNHNSGGCGHLADAGTWLAVCQPVYPTGVPVRRVSSTVMTNPKPGGTAESYLVANTEFGTYKLNVTTSDGYKWESRSPDEFGMIKHFGCVFSALGEQHAVFNQQIGTSPDSFVAIGSLHDPADKHFFSYLGVL